MESSQRQSHIEDFKYEPEQAKRIICQDVYDHFAGTIFLPVNENDRKKFMGAQKLEDKKRQKRIADALHPHILVPPNNVYVPTETPKTVEVPGSKITIQVRQQKIKVEDKEREVAQVIVEPEDKAQIKETHIILGGYSVNTPYYYEGFMPFASTGLRFVFINALGGGTEEYLKRPKRISLFEGSIGGETDINKHYTAQAGAEISALMKEFHDNPVVLEGFSLGGLIVAKLLARGDFLSTDLIKKIDRVTLDAPLAAGRLPFGVGKHLAGIIASAMKNKFLGAAGIPQTIPEGLIRDIMLPPRIEFDGKTEEYEDILRQVKESCFKATGVFPSLVGNLDADPLVDMAKDKKKTERFDAVKKIPINLLFRSQDKTVPEAEIQLMMEKWLECGYDAERIFTHSLYEKQEGHMMLPNQSWKKIWRSGHGFAGRLSPRKEK